MSMLQIYFYTVVIPKWEDCAKRQDAEITKLRAKLDEIINNQEGKA